MKPSTFFWASAVFCCRFIWTRNEKRQDVDEKRYFPAAKLGVTKINIDTDGRLVWRPIHREFFRDHSEKFDLREPGKIFMPAYAEYIIHKNQALGSAGHLEEVRGVVSK